MRRETSLLLTLGLLSVIVPPIFAQDLQSQPDPVPPTNAIGPQLIAWSELQKPRPIPLPQPVPDPDRNAKYVEQKPRPATPSAESAQNEQARAVSGNNSRKK